MTLIGSWQESSMNESSPRLGALLLVVMLMVPSTGWAATFNVTTGSDADCSDLDCDLQSALTAAQSNSQADVVRVAQGTYVGNFVYTAGAGENYNITLEGGWNAAFSSRTLDPTNTILDGNNAGRVLTIDNNTNSTTGSIELEGFTIKRGQVSGAVGGGVLAGGYPPGEVVLNRNIIENNTATTTHGGGFFLYSHDSASHTGSNVVLSNNIVRNNTAGPANSQGGGGYLSCSLTCLVVNNLVYGNNATSTGVGQGWGGGLMLYGLAGDIYVINNTITGNNAYYYGGGVALAGASWDNAHFSLYNNVVRGNTYTNGFLGDTDIFNTISQSSPSAGNSLLVSHNDYQGFATWPNPPAVTPTFVSNINANCFVGGGDYHLAGGTSCIDAGDNSAPSLPYADLDGYARICDGDGNGSDIVTWGRTSMVRAPRRRPRFAITASTTMVTGRLTVLMMTVRPGPMEVGKG